MGALKNVGIDPKAESFQQAYILRCHDYIAAGTQPSIDAIDLSFGFNVPLPSGEKAKVMAASFRDSALKEDSEFRNNFIPAVGSIFDLLDTIPAVNVLKPLLITDPTAPLLPVLSAIVEILASIGIPNPNEVLMAKLPQFLEKASALTSIVKDIATGGQQAIESAVNKLAELINEIFPEISIATLKSRISDSIEKIKENFNLKLPELEIPSITDFIEFFGLKIPKLPDLPEIPTIDDIIAMFFNFELEIPPIGAMFVELLKVKLDMLRELLTMPANIPSWLKSAIEKIKELFATGNIDIMKILKAVAESVFNYFFEKINATKIKNLIEKAPSLVSILHATVLVLVGSLVTLVVGILFGEGLIMKASAIGLGLIS